MYVRRYLSAGDLLLLPVGSVAMSGIGYSSYACQNSHYKEIDPDTAWQKSTEGMWEPVANITIWLNDHNFYRLKPWLLYDPRIEQLDISEM